MKNTTGIDRKIDKEQMLITMPYLTIKHETRVPSRSFREEEKSSLAHQIEEVVHQIKRPEMCERALVRCQRPALLCTYSQTGLNTNQCHVVTPRNQGCQEQISSRTSINRPSITDRQEPQLSDSCEAL